MAKKISFLFFIFSAISLLKAFSGNNTESFWKNIPSLATLPQEKIYLHFDKPFYAAGDHMWYRAYLVDANSHIANSKSAAVYVELIDNKDSVIVRQKIVPKESVFSGSILLKDDLPEGIYIIRAYTNWMRNVGEDFFYIRRFFIGNSISSQVKTTVRYIFSDKKIEAIINFHQRNAPLSGKTITYVETTKDNISRQKKLITDQNGAIRIEFNRTQIKNEKPILSVRYEENTNKYNRDFSLPVTNNFDVEFFPEGGELIQGNANCIGFKAIGSDGFSTEIEGAIYDETGEKVCSFKSLHLGMGKFYLLPEEGKKYYALVKTTLGNEKRFNLPLVKAEGYALSVLDRRTKLIVNVLTENFPKTDSLLLIAHSRGKVFFQTYITQNKHSFSFNKKELRAGVVQFLLTDTKFNPLSERLFFIFPEDSQKISLQVPKESFENRQKVTARIIVKDKEGNPVKGSFSLSVTDATDVAKDETADNIINNLLLSSDLKGYIEEPGSYFNPDFSSAAEAIDALMLTQGWRRFDTSKALKGQKEKTPHYLEIGQEISGIVKTGLIPTPTKGTKVSIISTQNKYFDVQETDAFGRFSFRGFNFPDSTIFTLQALRPKGLKNAVEFFMDIDSFPPISNHLSGQEQLPVRMETYLNATNDKFFYENGMKTIHLKEIEVVAKARTNTIVDDLEFQINFEDYVLSGAALKFYEGKPFRSLLHSLPGMQTWNENAIPDFEKMMNDDTISMDDMGPRFSINGTIYTYNDVQGIDVSDLESVQVLRSFNSLAEKATYKNILIAINYKRGKSFFSSSNPNIIRFMPKGYAKKVEFYQPKYEVDAIRNNPTPDWRSTIYWQPTINTNEVGEAECSFWTADRNSPYHFILEGIGEQGAIYRYEETIPLFKNGYNMEIKLMPK
jgi:hypothetical protein